MLVELLAFIRGMFVSVDREGVCSRGGFLFNVAPLGVQVLEARKSFYN